MGSEEFFKALGGNWAALGFLVVVVPVAIYCIVKMARSRPRRRSGKDADDIDAGIKF